MVMTLGFLVPKPRFYFLSPLCCSLDAIVAAFRGRESTAAPVDLVLDRRRARGHSDTFCMWLFICVSTCVYMCAFVFLCECVSVCVCVFLCAGWKGKGCCFQFATHRVRPQKRTEAQASPDSKACGTLPRAHTCNKRSLVPGSGFWGETDIVDGREMMIFVNANKRYSLYNKDSPSRVWGAGNQL